VALVGALGAAGCSGGNERGDGVADEARSVTLVTHDSFVLSGDVLSSFTEETGIEVELVQGGDAVEVVNKAILTAGDPEGDVLFGVDNNLLTRVWDADLFEPYVSPQLELVDPDVQLDPEHRVTPVDRGDVCLNYDVEWFGAEGLAPPTALADLTRPEYADLTVVQDPSSSTPGLAFLLATIAELGEGDAEGGGWQQYWADLRQNGVEVGTGWEDTYYGRFSGGSGEGDRPIVVSYATSPAAEVVFADPRPETPPTAVVAASCFRQIEFAGVLRGSDDVDAAHQLVDFLLSREVQEDIPLQMFVFPVRTDATVPPEITALAVDPDAVLELPADEIGAQRDAWVEEWTDIVLG
jgi:thiamine transport system substrate-binding protein